jgi:hypothetical protein
MEIETFFNKIVKTKDGFMLRAFFINQLIHGLKMKEADAKLSVQSLIESGYFEFVDELYLRRKK